MTTRSIHLAAMVMACLAMPAAASAQAPSVSQPDVWRAFAGKMETGTELVVRLQNGQRFTASLVEAREDAVLLQPKTRLAVPVQPVPYEAILSLERRDGGMSAGKAAAIGVAAGGATFLAILLILMAALD